MESIAAIHLVSLAHAVKLNDMRQLMQQNIFKKRKTRKTARTQFNSFLPWVSLAKAASETRQENNRVIGKTMLLEGHAGVLFNFSSGE